MHRNTNTDTYASKKKNRHTQMAGSVKAGETCFSLKWGETGKVSGFDVATHSPSVSLNETLKPFVYAVNVDNKANILSLLNTCCTLMYPRTYTRKHASEHVWRMYLVVKQGEASMKTGRCAPGQWRCIDHFVEVCVMQDIKNHADKAFQWWV